MPSNDQIVSELYSSAQQEEARILTILRRLEELYSQNNYSDEYYELKDELNSIMPPNRRYVLCLDGSIRLIKIPPSIAQSMLLGEATR